MSKVVHNITPKDHPVEVNQADEAPLIHGRPLDMMPRFFPAPNAFCKDTFCHTQETSSTTTLQHPNYSNKCSLWYWEAWQREQIPVVRGRCKFTHQGKLWWAGNPEWWGSSQMSLWGHKNLRKFMVMGRSSRGHDKSKYHSYLSPSRRRTWDQPTIH